ncbi:MAG: hypothetical protein AAF922_15265 [Pseudomonadota bacterium]
MTMTAPKTALSQYEKLEATGVWRASADAQRLNVYIALGEASLIITDSGNRPLGHWSLAAVERRNPGKRPALYYPAGDPGQTLELSDEASTLIDALEKLRTAIGRKRPHPGRLRLLTVLGSFLVIGGLLAFWMPNAVREHVSQVLPDIKRVEIGRSLRIRLERVTGPACGSGDGPAALGRVVAALPQEAQPRDIAIMRNGVRGALALPGGTVLAGRGLVEDFETPDVFAGFVLAETLHAQRYDPLAQLLDHATMWEAIRLLTTGEPPPRMLDRYAETVLTASRPMLSTEELLIGFTQANLPTTPYAYALDVTGETTLGLIEADPFIRTSLPSLLSDADWIRLQGICGA